MDNWLYKNRRILLLLAAGVAFFLRLQDLPGVGLAEDEVNKVKAVSAYLAGDFTENAGHPMFMKTLILAAQVAADGYNRVVVGPWGLPPVAPETVVRFPNVLFGALTVLALYLVGEAFFSWRAGLLAALFWATGINAVLINRVAKEDTVMVFFLLLGFYFHRRMKLTSDDSPRRKSRFYFASAACFGAMLATKYFPHYIGLNMLYFYWHRKISPESYPPDAYGKKELLKYLLALALVFVLLNPMILNPTVVRYLLHYTAQGAVTHHGYYMLDTLYYNNVSPVGSTPWYFYLLYLAVKTPPLILAAAAAGLGLCLARRRSAGPFFLLFLLGFWLVPYSLFGVKFMRYTLSLMPVVYLLAAVGFEGLCQALKVWLPRVGFRWAATGTLVLFLTASLFPFGFSPPYYSLYVNSLGGGTGRVGYYFPHDEYYDLLLREAIVFVAASAPRERTFFAGETPAVFDYYLDRCRRPDIRVLNLSDRAFAVGPEATVFVFLQPGRRYFENVEFYQALWDRTPGRVGEFRALGQPAIRVFRLSPDEFMRIADARGYFATTHRQCR